MEKNEKNFLSLKSPNSSCLELNETTSLINQGDLNIHKISIAPMLNITDNYFRSFIRLLTNHAVLYTEMIHPDTIINSPKGYQHELLFEEEQHPIVIQLGGNNPTQLGHVSQLCKQMGFDEINLNCGCPSNKVQSHNFGAVLMENPALVTECVKTMRNQSNLPTTVKCRLGLNSYNESFFHDFINKVSTEGGINHFIIHSRIALMGLDTDKNRKIPPLQYDKVFEAKRKFFDLNFSINGGFKTLDDAENILEYKKTESFNYYNTSNENLIFEDNKSNSNDYSNNLVGCMIGRAAYENPWILADIDRRFYNKQNNNYSKKDVVLKYADFLDKKAKQLESNLEQINYEYTCMIRPLTYLFSGERGTNDFKRNLSSLKDRRKDPNFSIYEHIMECFDKFEKKNPRAVQLMPDNE